MQTPLGARQAALLTAARVGPLLRRKGPENAADADICMWQRHAAAPGLKRTAALRQTATAPRSYSLTC